MKTQAKAAAATFSIGPRHEWLRSSDELRRVSIPGTWAEKALEQLISPCALAIRKFAHYAPRGNLPVDVWQSDNG